MRTTTYISGALLALAGLSAAQIQSVCPSSDTSVCYAINVPAASAKSGSGDIFIQIKGPSSKQWIGLGQGAQMAGANMIIVYANAAGDNITVSPRLGTGEVEPKYNKDAKVELLSGSGITNGMMTANIKCSSCTSWSGGSMSTTDSGSDWICSNKDGDPIKSDSPSADLQEHDVHDTFTVDLTKATGGSSANPFTAASSSGPSSSGSSSSGGSSSGGSSSGSSSGGGSSTRSMRTNMIIAHGTLMGLAFLGFFPLGSVLIRVMTGRQTLWVHAGVQMFAWALSLAGMGIGIWIAAANGSNLLTDEYHPKIGLVVVCVLSLQPISGLLHHFVFYKRTAGPSLAGQGHAWLGRALVLLGGINGIFGLLLAERAGAPLIAWAVLLSVVYAAWVGVVVFTIFKKPSGGGSPTVEKAARSGDRWAEGSN